MFLLTLKERDRSVITVLIWARFYSVLLLFCEVLVTFAIRYKNVMLRAISRPWMSFVFGVWFTLLIVWYQWPMDDTKNVLEKQNEMLKMQLRVSHNHLEELTKDGKKETLRVFNTSRFGSTVSLTLILVIIIVCLVFKALNIARKYLYLTRCTHTSQQLGGERPCHVCGCLTSWVANIYHWKSAVYEGEPSIETPRILRVK